MRQPTKKKLLPLQRLGKLKPTHHHFKGGEYTLLGYGTLEKTQEQYAIYRSCDSGIIWLRPVKEFRELVPRFAELQELVPRFAPIQESQHGKSRPKSARRRK